MKNKIIIAIAALVIVVGIVMAVTMGFNMGSNYGTSKRLATDYRESFEITDVEDIAKDIFKDRVIKVDYTDKFKAGTIVTVSSCTDEEVEAFEAKLKEKYPTFNLKQDSESTENEEEEETNKVVTVIEMPEVAIYDLIKGYIKPLVIVTIVTLVFFAVVFRKLGIVKSVALPAVAIIAANAVYVAIIAILRIPVNEYTIGVGLVVYALSLMSTAICLKNKKEMI